MNHPRSVSLNSCAVLILACLFASYSGRAVQAQPVASQAASLDRLKVGLDTVYWDSVQRGPLLAVAPESVLPAWRSATQVSPIGPNGNYVPYKPPAAPERMVDGQYRLTDLADFFGQRVIRLKGLSVLAPNEMVVLNTHLGKPDYFANLPRVEKARLLQSSLSTDQWKRLGSEGGLGLNDLSKEQQDVFLSYLPDPLVVRWTRTVESFFREPVRDKKPIVLSGEARRSVRLRINRNVLFKAPIDFGGDPSYSVILATDSGKEYPALYDVRTDERNRLYGHPIRTLQPNRLKPQQIDFSAPALQIPVSLWNVKTVGEMVKRIRTVTRTEIVVDGRVADLPLWIRAREGQTARAGDVLQALCWSLTGAIRYVSDSGNGSGKTQGKPNGVFLLTQDLEGIGSRIIRIKEWAQAADEHAAKARRTLQASILPQRPLQFFGFAPGDPTAVEGEIGKALEDDLRTNRQARWDGTKVSVSDLSPQLQEGIRAGMAAYAKANYTINGQHRNILENGTVSAVLTIRYNLIVPGVGDVASDFQGFSSLEDVVPFPETKALPPIPESLKSSDTVSIPSSMPLGGMLCVSPATESEASRVVQAARQKGLNQVWILLPLMPSSPAKEDVAKSKAFLAAAITEAAKKPTLTIVAGVRLFSVPLAADLRIERDVMITGERPLVFLQQRSANFSVAEADIPESSSERIEDWAAPGEPGLPMRLVRTLREIVTTKGLGGLALLNTAPPGYCLPDRKGRMFTSEYGAEVGYTPTLRLAFIRSAGYDPIDLVSVTGLADTDMRLPYFADGDRYRYGAESPEDFAKQDGTVLWNRFRFETVSKTMTEIYTPLRATLDSLPSSSKPATRFPIYIQNLDTSASGNEFSLWNSALALPRRGEQKSGRQDILGDARSVSPISLLEIGRRELPAMFPSGVPGAFGAEYARKIKAAMNAYKGSWSGLVLNLSELPVDRALELLEGIVPDEKATNKTKSDTSAGTK